MKRKLYSTIILSLILLILNIVGLPIEKNLDKKVLGNVSGNMYSIKIGDQNLIYRYDYDSEKHLRRSRTKLYENGQILTLNNSSNHKDIEIKGSGRYSHWRNTLYFSSSDGTSPKLNNLSYSIKYYVYPSLLTNIIIILLFIVFLYLNRVSKNFIQSIKNLIKKYLFDCKILINDYIQITEKHKYIIFIGLVGILFIYHDTILVKKIEDLNQVDEVTYISTGLNLLKFNEIWPYSRGPLIQYFYSLIYIFTGFLDNWLLFSANLARYLFIVLTYISQIILLCELRKIKIFPLWLGLILIPTSFYIENINNPSYSLSLPFYILSLCTLLAYIRLKSFTALINCALVLSLYGLCRPDFISSIFVVILIMILVDLNFSVIKKLFIFVALVLFLPIVTINIYYIVHGNYNIGVSNKFYNTFESSEILTFTDEKLKAGDVAQWNEMAVKVARERYGSPEENHNSVMIAILKNPKAFFDRQFINNKITLNILNNFFYKSYIITISLIILYIIGILTIFRNDIIAFLAIIMWNITILPYYITMMYPAYLIPQISIFILISIIGFSKILDLKRT